MKAIFALACLVTSTFGRIRYDTAWKETIIEDFENVDHKIAFRNWQKEFNREYVSIEEEASKFAVFLQNWKDINDFNLGRDHSYTVGVNQFADMTAEEFRLYIHGDNESCLKKRPAYASNSMKTLKERIGGPDLPDSVDWTTEGVVTPVKDQGSCGSCWAFSTTGSTESAYAIKTGTLKSLSEQQLVDCSGSYGNDGCEGGLMDYAFQYIKATGGLCSEDEYPYTGEDGTCNLNSCGTFYDSIDGYEDVTEDSSGALETGVAAGPVSIAVQADQFSFEYYSGGVLTGTCGTSLDHGVLAVGYGTDDGTEYWKVKNSWGSSWGMEGYLLICRDCGKNGDKGECGINMEPSYPIAK